MNRFSFLAILVALEYSSVVQAQSDSSESLGAPVAVEQPEPASEAPAFSYTGTITAHRVAALSPRVAGLVQTADAEAGFEATQGETLVQLDDTLARLAVREGESELRSVRAELEEAQRRLQEAVELGERNFPRTEREARASAVRLAEVAVARVETTLERQRELVDRHKVVAPFDGVVQRKRAEIGEWAQTGTPVIELVSVADLRLDVQIPQEQLELAASTEQVEIRIAGFNDRMIEGHIQAIAPAIDPGTRSLLVRVGLDDPPPLIRPGMSARAIFRPNTEEHPLMISRDAIIRSAEGQTLVWIVHGQEGDLRAARRVVELGATRGNRVEVRSGVSDNDRVVVRGNESLRDGQQIRIVETAANRGATGG